MFSTDAACPHVYYNIMLKNEILSLVFLPRNSFAKVVEIHRAAYVDLEESEKQNKMLIKQL